MSRFYPCAGLPGDQITIYGSHLLGIGAAPSVRIGGANAAIVSQSDNKIVATIPAGAADGDVEVSTSIGVSSKGPFHLGGASVAESEPNDDINGANATNVTDMGAKASGTLSSVSDKDHFRFDCMRPNLTYRIKVTPRVVGTIYVNGVASSVDASGYASVVPSATSVVIGLTGGVGAYTLTMSIP